jgi:predicted nucleotidyltransferase
MGPGAMESAMEREIKDFFQKRSEEVICVYLFGSRARGTAREDSDLDLGVLFARDRSSTGAGTLADLPLDLEAELEHLLGIRVQIVALNGAPADLVHRVLRDGKLLLDHDPPRRVRFEVRRRNEFFDLQPILGEYRRFP